MRIKNARARRLFERFVVTAIVMLLVVACGGSADEPESATEPPEAGDEEPEEADDAYVVPDEYQRLVLVGSSQGGIHYNLMVAASQLFNEELGMQTSVQAGGTQANAIEIESGDILVATTSPIDLIEAMDDPDAPDNAERLRTFWAFNRSDFHLLAAADSDIESFEDLAGQRVATGTTATLEAQIIETAFECAGIDVADVQIQNISKAEATSAFADGSIDAWTGFGGLPTGAFVEAFESSRGARMMSMPDDVIECLIDRYVYVQRGEIPAGVYTGQDASHSTIQLWFDAVASADLPEELVYHMARVLHEQHDRFVAAQPAADVATAENTAEVAGFELHPGTQRLLEELGLL